MKATRCVYYVVILEYSKDKPTFIYFKDIDELVLKLVKGNYIYNMTAVSAYLTEYKKAISAINRQEDKSSIFEKYVIKIIKHVFSDNRYLFFNKTVTYNIYTK
jgi:hypothetical protein